MEAEKIQELHATKKTHVYVYDETMSPSDVRCNLLDNITPMGPYESWVTFTRETEPVDPTTASDEQVARGRKQRAIEPNEVKASNLHDEIKLRVVSDDDVAPRKVLDVCKAGKLSDALEELLGQVVSCIRWKSKTQRTKS